MYDPLAHPNVEFALNIVDKAIKLAAVVIGGLWSYWNYRKGRRYQQRLELEVAGTVFLQGDLYGDVMVAVKNIGGTKHPVQRAGTYCDLLVVRDDLSEQHITQFHVFPLDDKIEPGESIDDICYWRIAQPIQGILWVKLVFRVVSNGVEWSTSSLIRVVNENKSQSIEVI